MSRLLDTTGAARQAGIDRAVEVLRDSSLVALPTDTAYALVADAFDLDATAALLAAKDRDRVIPLSVLIRTPKQLPGIAASVREEADRLIAAFWPGPLTLVLPAQPGMRWDLGRTEGTVAVRMPLDEVALAVIREIGPLAAAAANPPGAPAPDDAATVLETFGDRLALVLDDGPRPQGGRSTIVDLTRRRVHVLRDGLVPTALVLDVAEGRTDPFEAASALQEQDDLTGVDRLEDRPEGRPGTADQ